jgi:peptidase M1-like protein/type IX secretion system substrate protein
MHKYNQEPAVKEIFIQNEVSLKFSTCYRKCKYFQFPIFMTSKQKQAYLMIKKVIYFLFMFIEILISSAQAQTTYPTDPRSDTIDILHTDIQLDLSDKQNKNISGTCSLTILPKLNDVKHLYLDLLQLNIDAVKLDTANLNYQYNDTLIHIRLPKGFDTTDTFTVGIQYHGQPKTDNSGWGGFYFTGNYAFNLGVGFAADPHNFGRTWFPCLDNFTEKSTYSMEIITDSTEMAMCSGLLRMSNPLPDGKTEWLWELSEPVPSYLVSMAVANYTPVQSQYQGISSTFPVWLNATPTDSAKMKNSFVHLPDAIAAFEQAYGPQPFGKVGFTLVPFNGGAMEHATNIAYPRFAADGSRTYETLMAHELSHHWWGDFMTCATAEDMWLNEGWASYSENIFLEYVYGRQRYKKVVRDNHNDVLHRAHIRDDGFRALSGLPHAYTYGDHAYNKGADVAHTLRGYLGDTLFYTCIKGFLQQYAFDNASSLDFMQYMKLCAGPEMEDFFKDWVFQPGFPHFSIDSVLTEPDGNGFLVKVFIRQRLYAAPNYYDNIPLEITFMDNQWNKTTKKITMKGRCGIFNVSLPFEPVFTAIDMEERISDAISDEYHVFNATTFTQQTDAYLAYQYIDFSTDSILIRTEHNWVAPDRMKNKINGLHLNDRRYWKIDGIFPADATINAKILYNGANNTQGNLDNHWITNSEDSIVLMYRSSAADDWEIYPDYILNTLGSKTDKMGQIIFTGIQKGEYALAIYDHSRQDSLQSDIPATCTDLNTSVREREKKQIHFVLSPNPANEIVRLDWLSGFNPNQIKLTGINGQVAGVWNIESQSGSFTFPVKQLPEGIYLVQVITNGKIMGSQKLIVVH